MKLTALINTCRALANKATAGMNTILKRTLMPPINATGIISKTNITVTPTATGCIIESHLPDYAYWTDKGRLPGKRPPIRSLTDWCIRHKGKFKGDEWALATKIAKHGTKPKNFTTPLHRMVGLLLATLPKAVVTDVVAWWNTTFKDMYGGVHLVPHSAKTDIPKEIKL